MLCLAGTAGFGNCATSYWARLYRPLVSGSTGGLGLASLYCEVAERRQAGYAAACARPALAIFERDRPDGRRPRAAVDAAQAFAEGAQRTRALRDSAWAAQRAAQEARDAGQAAASDAARAALSDEPPAARGSTSTPPSAN